MIEGYSDANWITWSNNVKSTSRYVFIIGGREASWKSSTQTCIARSTMESEFIALYKAGEEDEWLLNFLEDISFLPKPIGPFWIHCDSKEIIGSAESVMYNGKSRHIRRRHDTARQLLYSGIITITYVKSRDYVLDLRMKVVLSEQLKRSFKGMSLRLRTSRHDGNSF